MQLHLMCTNLINIMVNIIVIVMGIELLKEEVHHIQVKVIMIIYSFLLLDLIHHLINLQIHSVIQILPSMQQSLQVKVLFHRIEYSIMKMIIIMIEFLRLQTQIQPKLLVFYLRFYYYYYFPQYLYFHFRY